MFTCYLCENWLLWFTSSDSMECCKNGGVVSAFEHKLKQPKHHKVLYNLHLWFFPNNIWNIMCWTDTKSRGSHEQEFLTLILVPSLHCPVRSWFILQSLCCFFWQSLFCPCWFYGFFCSYSVYSLLSEVYWNKDFWLLSSNLIREPFCFFVEESLTSRCIHTIWFLRILSRIL